MKAVVQSPPAGDLDDLTTAAGKLKKAELDGIAVFKSFQADVTTSLALENARMN